jgi:phospholipid-binding lipoprotein MlaA
MFLIMGCATRNAAEQDDYSDPLEPLNRVTFRINDLGDKYLLRPVAKGYERIMPAFIRTGINNFFDNLNYTIDIANALLQGKFKQAASDTGRLALNTTLGFGGFLDPATDAGLAKHDEDFGQTLAVWGVPAGPYLVVPLFGPKTFRSGVGTLGDLWLAPQLRLFSSSVQTKVNIVYLIHQRSTLLGIDAELDRAFDRYAFIRDSYLQNRKFLRYDGNLPEEDLYLEDEGFDDEFDDEEFEDFGDL